MSAMKTIVATGATSGLGFELVKQLLLKSEPYRFILGARDMKRTQAAYDDIKYDADKHSLTILPLNLSNLREVKTFSRTTLERLGKDKLDYLFLNAAISFGAEEPTGPNGSKWCDSYIVNHLSQHYLTHLLREKLTSSQSRVVVVSSGAVKIVSETKALDKDVRAGSGATGRTIYPATKFIQLLSAHYWRRELPSCTVLAVSPGLIPNTGLGVGAGMKLTMDMPDAKSVPEGAQNLWRAFTIDDFPQDPEQIFLTSWGEWWPKDVYGATLDKELQARWCPSKEEIEKEENLLD
ncbi:NAD(P)-binding protein [Atractiella rhizophila]|nr:NAD(P)-binding protein [Atractiella rhizophila]